MPAQAAAGAFLRQAPKGSRNPNLRLPSGRCQDWQQEGLLPHVKKYEGLLPQLKIYSKRVDRPDELFYTPAHLQKLLSTLPGRPSRPLV